MHKHSLQKLHTAGSVFIEHLGQHCSQALPAKQEEGLVQFITCVTSRVDTTLLHRNGINCKVMSAHTLTNAIFAVCFQCYNCVFTACLLTLVFTIVITFSHIKVDGVCTRTRSKTMLANHVTLQKSKIFLPSYLSGLHLQSKTHFFQCFQLLYIAQPCCPCLPHAHCSMIDIIKVATKNSNKGRTPD